MGTVAMAAIAFVAMIVSIVAALKSGRHAGKAAKALEDIADAQTQQSGAVVQQATDERRELARLVTVDAALYMGQKGVTVHNGSSTYTVHDIDFDFPDDDEVVVISARGTEPQSAPVEIPKLGPGESIAQRSVFQKIGGADQRTLIREARIRFRDGRGDDWERIGNQEPVRIDRPRR